MGEGRLEEGALGVPNRIGVCVGRDQRGINALKWALEKIISPQGHVCLLHVKPPLRWIPNPMGGQLPVDQVNPEMVKRFQEDRILDTKRIVENFIKLCNRKKVTSELCYSENDSIQKEVVDQITKLRITKLVLETSSQNVLTKVLKKESISAYIAKHAPDFCSVIVVRKGKLYSVKDATRSAGLGSPISTTADFRSSISSETSTSNGKPTEDQMMTVTSFQHDGEVLSGGQYSAPYLRMQQSASMDISREPSAWLMPQSNDFSGPQSASMDISREPSAWLMPQSNDFSGPQSAAAKVMVKNHSALPRFSGSVAATPFHEGPNRVNHCQRQDNDKVCFVTGLESHTSVANGYSAKSFPSSMHIEDLGVLATSLAACGRMEDTSQLMLPNNSDCDALSQHSLDMNSTGSSSVEVSSSQNSLNAMENIQMDSNSAFGRNEALPDMEFDVLQRQLNEAKLSSQQWAQREAERRANNFKLAEEMVENAKKKISEYERHRDAAVNEARLASQRMSYCQKELERVAAMLQAALRDQEALQKRLAEEVRRHVVTQKDLETTRQMADAFATTAELAERELEAERSRCKEAFSKLEELTKQLERECQLRKEAEERASQDAFAKREAVKALRKEQKKYSEYSFQELQIATNNFDEENKLGQGGYGPVYKGKLHHTTVAIKVLAREGSQGHEEFQKEVELLSRIHHPHMVMLLGACPENGCIVYEYMANGSLEDRLNCRDDTPPLPWYVRFRICLEVATALLFLHSRPQPVVHRDLKPGNILLDHHFVSKISDVGLAKLVPNNVTFSVTMYEDTMLVGTLAYMDPDYQRTGVVSCESDVYSLGIIMLQLLTGRQAVGVTYLVEQAVDNGRLEEVLDKSAGEWPLAEAIALACLGLQCTEPRRKHRPNLETKLLPELERIQGIADATIAYAGPSSSGEMPIIPGSFFCPILQEIMENPHIAADGFTYEYDAIKLWLEEHDTSPMTNLVLGHNFLMPNLSLRSAIKEWYDKGLL